jgi:hypothetical protein
MEAEQEEERKKNHFMLERTEEKAGRRIRKTRDELEKKGRMNEGE